MEELLKLRLQNQGLGSKPYGSLSETMSNLLALQAQDYGQVKWVVGSRLPNCSEQTVDDLVNSGKLVRTWFMRGTYQLVRAEDVRWLMMVTSPRVNVIIKSRLLQFGLDDVLINKCRNIFTKVLDENKHLSREELVAILLQKGISMSGLPLLHLLQKLSIDGVICASRKLGGDFEFTRYDDWIPKTDVTEYDEALQRLSRAYFTTRGPATLADFQWWSGLTQAECKKALQLISKELSEMKINETSYWFREPEHIQAAKQPSRIKMLGGFDEYLIAYRDRTAMLAQEFNHKVITKNGLFSPIILCDGKVIGTWKRVVKPKLVEVSCGFFNPKDLEKKELILKNLALYQQFMQREMTVTFSDQP